MKIYSFILLLSVTICSSAAQPEFTERRVVLHDTKFNIQIAASNEQRLHGLMHRASLATDAGMLFVYPSTGEHRIWMKNTLIPLTVIWLDEQLRIIYIRSLLPCKQPKCPVYGAPRPSRYVLELHATKAERFRIGDRLQGLRAALP